MGGCFSTKERGRKKSFFKQIVVHLIRKPYFSTAKNYINNYEGGRSMKKWYLTGLLLCASALPIGAQQIIYANLDELREERGDTVSTLQAERRSLNQLYLMGGGDYRILSPDNRNLTRYLRKRAYAVRIDTSLYVNCRKMRYKRYKLGGWYAPALVVNRHIFYAAQPVGQAATETLQTGSTGKLPGEVGDAIEASGLVNKRVFYELNPDTGRSSFVGRERMRQLLAGHPQWLAEFEQETSEAAEVTGKYLLRLR